MAVTVVSADATQPLNEIHVERIVRRQGSPGQIYLLCIRTHISDDNTQSCLNFFLRHQGEFSQPIFSEGRIDMRLMVFKIYTLSMQSTAQLKNVQIQNTFFEEFDKRQARSRTPHNAALSVG